MFNDPQSQKYGKEFNKMYRNNLPNGFMNYLKDLGPMTLYNGCLDPVEAINNYKKEKRAQKVREILGKLKALEEKDSIRKATFLPRIETGEDVDSIRTIKETPE